MIDILYGILRGFARLDFVNGVLNNIINEKYKSKNIARIKNNSL